MLTLPYVGYCSNTVLERHFTANTHILSICIGLHFVYLLLCQSFTVFGVSDFLSGKLWTTKKKMQTTWIFNPLNQTAQISNCWVQFLKLIKSDLSSGPLTKDGCLMLLDCIFMFVNVSYLMYFQHIIHVQLVSWLSIPWCSVLFCSVMHSEMYLLPTGGEAYFRLLPLYFCPLFVENIDGKYDPDIA